MAIQIDELSSYGTDENIRNCWTTLRKFDVFPVASVTAYSSLEHLYGKNGVSEFITNAGGVVSMLDKFPGICYNRL